MWKTRITGGSQSRQGHKGSIGETSAEIVHTLSYTSCIPPRAKVGHKGKPRHGEDPAHRSGRTWEEGWYVYSPVRGTTLGL